MNLWQVFSSGGPIMWPLALCSVFSLAIILEKFLFFYNIRIDAREFLNQILDHLKHNRVKDALDICDKLKHPLSNILKSGILRYDRPRPQIKEAIEDASLYEIPRMEKNLSLLATIAHIAPLLGFLGTCLGMVRVFQVIQSKAGNLYPVSPSDLAAGIWQALIATVAGLVIAIPTYAAYNYFVSRVNNFILEMEKAATELVNFLTE